MIKVKRKSDGQVFTTDMSADNKFKITEIHFCTSYTQVIVQEEKDGKFPTMDLIVEPIGSIPNAVDLIATQNDEAGEFV